MITIKTNIPGFTQSMLNKIEKLRDRETMLRPIATELIPLMTERIHQNGEDKDNQAIGTYSKGYLKFRQKNKRNADPKIIVSLTRQLENDWSVIATEKGYGIGFLNSFNLQKARWVEAVKHSKIFQLSASELQYAKDRITEIAHATLNQ